MATPEEIRATIDQYVVRFSAGDAAGWVALFADDARQEDPVGAPVNVGHDAIGAFYETMLALGGPQLSFVREPIILGNEAVVFLQAVSGEGPTAGAAVHLRPHDLHRRRADRLAAGLLGPRVDDHRHGLTPAL